MNETTGLRPSRQNDFRIVRPAPIQVFNAWFNDLPLIQSAEHRHPV
jgi:hypothetical protein